MQQSEFSEWATRHATIFGFAFESELGTLLSWFDVFRNCEARELHAVTDEMSRRPGETPKLRDHRGILLGLLREWRAVSYSRSLENAETRGACTTCSGYGWVVVPALQGVKYGNWVPLKVARGGSHYYTSAVLCSCHVGAMKGERIRTTERRPDPPMRLERYATLNPNWRQQFAEHGRQLSAEGRAEKTELTETLDAVLASLRAGQREPGIDEST